LDGDSAIAWLASYGYLILPFDLLNILLGGMYDREGSSTIVSVFLGVIGALIGFASVAILRGRDLYSPYLLGAWSVIGIFIATSDLKYISHVDLFAWLVGGAMLLLSLKAIISWRAVCGASDLALFSTLWAFGSIVLSWLTLGGRLPHVVFVTDHRYMAVPGAGFTLALASLLALLFRGLGSGVRAKISVYAVLAVAISINLVADQLYFERIRANRDLASWEHYFARK